jgi:dCMP deaminase
MSKPSWHDTFFEICEVLAKRSDDLATKLGAVIVGPDKEIVSTGYNGLPRGIRPTDKNLERPDKYLWTEHAEKNAIVNATRYGANLKGCKLYCTWPPCAACARSIVQAGIVEVHFKQVVLKMKWCESMDVSMRMLFEARVAVVIHNGSNLPERFVYNGRGINTHNTPAVLVYKPNDPDESGEIRS